MSKWQFKYSVAVIAGFATLAALPQLGASAAEAQQPAASDAARSEPTDSSYTWSAELVAFDAAANTITARAMLVSNPERTDFAKLKAGDRAMLTWSGLWVAAGVRAVERGSASSFDRLTMPVEFVAAERDDRYLTFKVPVPAADAARLAVLKPGEYVTATSPLRATTAAEAVMAIKPYSDAS
jgi:hypothetical protein